MSESNVTGWLEFDDKPVMLQLRHPYVGVTYTYEATPATNGQGVRASEMLSGVLSVRPGHESGRLMLVLRVPVPPPAVLAEIAIHPDDVLYCTHIRMQEALETLPAS